MSSSVKRETKKGIDANETRRRREAVTVAIRKDKKEENLSKRRNFDSIQYSEPIADTMRCDGTEQHSAKSRQQYSISDIPMLLSGLKSDIYDTQLNSLRGFRRLLSQDKNVPVNECNQYGVISIFVQFLSS